MRYGVSTSEAPSPENRTDEPRAADSSYAKYEEWKGWTSYFQFNDEDAEVQARKCSGEIDGERTFPSSALFNCERVNLHTSRPLS